MVILFGSHARGDWVEDPAGGYFSDFDVLVIVKSPKLVEKHELWSKIEDRARRIVRPTELSLIVHDISDVNEQLEKGFYFFSDIKKEGILLYDSRTIRAGGGQGAHAGRAASAGAAVVRTVVRERRRVLPAIFESASTTAWNNVAAFELHQATERYYHCVLLVITAYKPKTHNIEDLGKRAGDLHPLLRNVFPRGDARSRTGSSSCSSTPTSTRGTAAST